MLAEQFADSYSIQYRTIAEAVVLDKPSISHSCQSTHGAITQIMVSRREGSKWAMDLAFYCHRRGFVRRPIRSFAGAARVVANTYPAACGKCHPDYPINLGALDRPTSSTLQKVSIAGLGTAINTRGSDTATSWFIRRVVATPGAEVALRSKNVPRVPNEPHPSACGYLSMSADSPLQCRGTQPLSLQIDRGRKTLKQFTAVVDKPYNISEAHNQSQVHLQCRDPDTHTLMERYIRIKAGNDAPRLGCF